MASIDEFFMGIALELARKGVGRTSPNPAVGAVLVRNGQVVGEGYHQKAGTPHAEVHALRAAGENSRGATLYVTLEPCCHYGKTPPCTEALVAAGIKRVVLATLDPNPRVAGQGARYLELHGVEVVAGVLEDEARQLNQAFFKRIQTGLPWVALKWAMTMDGKIATRAGDSKWISGEESRAFVHELRNRLDVVMVGAGTVLADDPRLNVRIQVDDVRQPVRAVVDGSLRIPPEANVIRTARSQRTIVFCCRQAPGEREEALTSQGAEVVRVGGTPEDLDLEEALKYLAEEGMLSVLVEGGGELNWRMVSRGLADYLYLFIAPRLVGGRNAVTPVGGEGYAEMDQAAPVFVQAERRIGDDMLIEARIGSDKRW